MDSVDDLRAAVEAALGAWTGADWTHEWIPLCDDPCHGQYVPCPSCRPPRDEQGEPRYCCGGDAECQVCADAESDARAADDAGRAAVVALDAGDLCLAIRELESADGLERAYGDSPIWRRPLDLARAIRDAVEEAPRG